MSLQNSRIPRFIISTIKPVLILIAFICLPCSSAFATEDGILRLGDTVITGFSGVLEPSTEAPDRVHNTTMDETIINPAGVSARITSLAAPGYVWDARVWNAAPVKEFYAKDVGQVFGVTLDDAEFPNIYLSATSAYGLHIVLKDTDKDGRPERLTEGDDRAAWMNGMWGKADPNGGPGSIWKIDGKTGKVSLFANVKFNNVDNAGGGLGNITYASDLKQLFVSDLTTGMIHRYDMDGNELEIYDHGTTGRISADLPAIAYDPKTVLDISSGDFDPEALDTWGYTDKDRRVWALAYHEGRLFYSVVGGNEIWSVGFDEQTGKFQTKARLELEVPKKPKSIPVSDIIFSNKGAMILAQRGAPKSTYDYKNFADFGKSRTYRYWLESPDDPKTPSRWSAGPEEYAIGFKDDERSNDGGVDLNYGYDKEGYIDTGACEASLWTTGDNLRNNKDLEVPLLKGGPLVIDGLQGMPAGPVKDYKSDNNSPPWVTYMVDYDPSNTDQTYEIDSPMNYSDVETTGWLGDLISYKKDCSGVAKGGYYGGPGYSWPAGPAYYTDTVYVPHDPYPRDEACTPGVNCPANPKQCVKQTGEFICDSDAGKWTYKTLLKLSDVVDANAIKIEKVSAGAVILGGKILPFSSPSSYLEIKGGSSGQLMSAGLCIFNKDDENSGQPYECCKTTIAVQAPLAACVKK